MRKRNKEKQKGKGFVKKKRVRRKKKGKGKRKEREKEKGRISRLSDGRSSTGRVLKLVHVARSTCGHQKLGVSTNSIR